MKKEKTSEQIKDDTTPKGAKFLYDTVFGRIILHLVTKRFVSNLAGKYMNTKLSTRHISSFIKDNNIDMKDYEKKEYKSFNEFFSRKIQEEKRPFSKVKKDFISPADSRFLAYKIEDNSTFIIKGKKYTTTEILRNENLAKEYNNGYFLVFRLCVDDYHRYSFVDNGSVLKEKKINGKFHTVGPIAFKRHLVFEENQREYSVLKTENFGKIVQMEVGALMVGKIVNHEITKFKKGQEKGYFLFGGSTVIIMVKENVIELDKKLLKNSLDGIETRVKQGETIGKKV